MKVKSNREVHIRAFEPYRRATNLKGILNPGFEIEVEVVEGEDILEGDGANQIRSSKWYKDKNGDFYWSGGFERIEKEEVTISNNDLYLKFAQSITDNANLKSKGEGLNIAVLDSGIEKSHTSIASKVSLSMDFLSDGTIVDYDHGTKVAGLLVAKEDKVFGICPDSNLYDFRVIANSGVVNDNSVVKALKYISEHSIPVNLVNMSLEIGANYVNDLQIEIDKLYEKNIYCIISTGDFKFSNQLKNIVKVQVGSGYNANKDSKNSILISFPNKSILSTSTNGKFSEFEDASAYTALVTGMLSTLFSSQYFTPKRSFDEIVSFFNEKLNFTI